MSLYSLNGKLIISLIFLILTVTAIVSVPIVEDHESLESNPDGNHVIAKRATCDLFSFQSQWFTPNHSACAAHCLVMGKGFKGGSCRNGVCVCRK